MTDLKSGRKRSQVTTVSTVIDGFSMVGATSKLGKSRLETATSSLRVLALFPKPRKGNDLRKSLSKLAKKKVRRLIAWELAINFSTPVADANGT